jgi:hypothetical protein
LKIIKLTKNTMRLNQITVFENTNSAIKSKVIEVGEAKSILLAISSESTSSTTNTVIKVYGSTSNSPHNPTDVASKTNFFAPIATIDYSTLTISKGSDGISIPPNQQILVEVNANDLSWIHLDIATLDAQTNITAVATMYR